MGSQTYVVSGSSRTRTGACLLLVVAAVLTGACDKVPLLAPTQSTITVSAPTRVLPSGGSTEITAVVMENSGTPVQNGTTVRFTSTLGRLDPPEAQTRSGLAVTTFFAGDNSGIAEIRASSGAATGGADAANLNVVSITIGAAAVDTVTIRANPGSVGPGGGTVELIASVVGANGLTLPGVVVNFGADQGSLSSTTATTNAAGEARTTLTTSQQTIASATAGTKAPVTVTVTLRAGPIVSITCTPVAGTVGANCAALQSSASNNTATVSFTVAKPATGSSALRGANIDFGDGQSQGLGNLAAGTTTVTHTYSGPSAPGTQSYTATVLATDVNGEAAIVSTPVIVTRPNPTPINVTIVAAQDTVPAGSRRWTFTATATEGSPPVASVVQSYTWNFGDGSGEVTTSGNTTAHVYQDAGTYEVTVTVRTADGRTGIGRTEIRVLPP